MASNLKTMASTLVALASNPIAMASTLVAMASTLVAMESLCLHFHWAMVAMERLSCLHQGSLCTVHTSSSGMKRTRLAKSCICGAHSNIGHCNRTKQKEKAKRLAGENLENRRPWTKAQHALPSDFLSPRRRTPSSPPPRPCRPPSFLREKRKTWCPRFMCLPPVLTRVISGVCGVLKDDDVSRRSKAASSHRILI